MHDVPFNWKIMVENFMEMYHNSRLHNGIHDFAPSSGAWYQDYEAGDGALFGFNQMVEPDGGFNPTFKALFPPLPGITMEERQRIVFAFVPPTLLLGFQPTLRSGLRSTQLGRPTTTSRWRTSSQGQRSSARTSTRRWMKRSTVLQISFAKTCRRTWPHNLACAPVRRRAAATRGRKASWLSSIAGSSNATRQRRCSRSAHGDDVANEPRPCPTGHRRDRCVRS